jgi:hypothetical protein
MMLFWKIRYLDRMKCFTHTGTNRPVSKAQASRLLSAPQRQ